MTGLVHDLAGWRDDVVRAIRARARAAQDIRPVSLALSFAALVWFAIASL